MIGISTLLCVLDFLLCLLFAWRFFDGARIAFVLALINKKNYLLTGGACILIALLEHGAAGEELLVCGIIASITQICLPRMVTTRFARRVIAGSSMFLLMACVLIFEPLPLLNWPTVLRVGGAVIGAISLID